MDKKKALDPETVAIGARIREARLARRMTVEQLAEAADTSSQFISKIEKGEQQMTWGRFGRLAKALGVTSDYLLYGSDKAVGRAALAAEYLGQLNVIDRDLVSRMIIGLQDTLAAIRPEQ